jgi:uncharacterized membrane protein YkoI
MKPVRSSLIAAAALALCAGGGVVRGQGVRPPAPPALARPTVRPRAQLSMDEAVRLAERRFRARVVRAETQTQGGRTIYVLRMLDGAGRVFAVRVDATSGAIL